MQRLLMGLTVGWLSFQSPLGAVGGVMEDEPRPLAVPTTSGPKLRLPGVRAPQPSLMLDKRSLQIKPTQNRPTLNVLPQPDVEPSGEGDLEESAPMDLDRRGLHLQHGR